MATHGRGEGRRESEGKGSGPPGLIARAEIGFSPLAHKDVVVLDAHVGQSKGEGCGAANHLAGGVVLTAVAGAHELVGAAVPGHHAAQVGADGVDAITADGSDVGLQVGAVVMLPDGFTLAPQDRWTEEMKEETEGVYFSQYSDDQPNILLVGPIPGDQHQEVVFPLLSPDPATDSNIHFGKYQLHVGGNRGRGQVYPTGEKSNNAVYTAPASGSVAAIEDGDNGSSILTINTADGAAVTETIPVGPQLLVNVGDNIEAGAALTNDPNVGGFGQVDAEIVLQNPVRIYGLLAFFAAVALAQIMLVLKKRQIEKVQAAEGNF